MVNNLDLLSLIRSSADSRRFAPSLGLSHREPNTRQVSTDGIGCLFRANIHVAY
jgi:hypothetical protein